MVHKNFYITMNRSDKSCNSQAQWIHQLKPCMQPGHTKCWCKNMSTPQRM